MTKSHPLHRKKAVHMKFRHSFRVRRLFWRMVDKLDIIRRERVSREQ